MRSYTYNIARKTTDYYPLGHMSDTYCHFPSLVSLLPLLPLSIPSSARRPSLQTSICMILVLLPPSTPTCIYSHLRTSSTLYIPYPRAHLLSNYFAQTSFYPPNRCKLPLRILSRYGSPSRPGLYSIILSASLYTILLLDSPQEHPCPTLVAHTQSCTFLFPICLDPLLR